MRVQLTNLVITSLTALVLSGVASAEALEEEDLARLEKTNLCVRCQLPGAALQGRDLRGAKLSYTVLNQANLSYSQLHEADLRFAQLQGANFKNALLLGAKLRGANLRSADFSGARLSGADLRGADLTGAKLNGAFLKGADLTGTRFDGADLSDARGITQKRLGDACGDAATKLPERLTLGPCPSGSPPAKEEAEKPDS